MTNKDFNTNKNNIRKTVAVRISNIKENTLYKRYLY